MKNCRKNVQYAKANFAGYTSDGPVLKFLGRSVLGYLKFPGRSVIRSVGYLTGPPLGYTIDATCNIYFCILYWSIIIVTF